MKNRLTTLDIVTLIVELREKLIGLRFDQLYDIDKKTYLIRFTKTETKILLLIESGSRFHTTSFEWPKNPAPSGFTMKLRKHLNNKRLESIHQIGADRVVDFQFGAEEFAVHLLLELYDKGNIILTDAEYNILSLVRPHVQGEDRLVAHQKYTIDKAKQSFSLAWDEMIEVVSGSPPGKSIREILLPKIEFGPGLFSHVLKRFGLSLTTKIPSKDAVNDEEFKSFESKLFEALEAGRQILESPENLPRGGFIVIQQQSKLSKNPTTTTTTDPASSSSDKLIIYDQFHPIILSSDFPSPPYTQLSFPSFDQTLDEFYSKIEAQKTDLKVLNQEKDAYKKLDRVKTDQLHRLNELKLIQQVDKTKGELIMFNQEVIESAIRIIRSLIANQIPWDDIWAQIQEASARGDEIAKRITGLTLVKNQFKMLLRDPYENSADMTTTTTSDIEVEIDLELSAYANASKFFDLKKASAKKEERTLESQVKAFKSTEKKTLSSLREVATLQTIKKLRKVYWFEKFHWFISSDNYLVLGGHDAQQNELLVKRYMGVNDIYLHADSHGAPTIIIKNQQQDGGSSGLASGVFSSPKTLNEAGTLAVCASGSWDSKIIATCWWVWGHQVSKSAPTGEYLPTGSFMIRGKKNYLPPCQLILGFGFLFRLTDESVPNHKGERSPRDFNNSQAGLSNSYNRSLEVETKEKEEEEEEPEINMSSDSESSDSNPDPDEFPDTHVPIQLSNDGGDSSNKGRTRTLSSVSSEVSHATTTTTLPDTNLIFGGDVDDPDNYVIVQSGVLPEFSYNAIKKGGNKKKQGDKNKKGGAGAGGGGGGGKGKVGGPPPGTVQQQQQQQNKSNNSKDQGIKEEIVENVENSDLSSTTKPKRGQHGRQKKLKEKYKFQDDEERELRMQLLQSKGKPTKGSKQATLGSGLTQQQQPNKKGTTTKESNPKPTAVQQPSDVPPTKQVPGEAVSEQQPTEGAAPVPSSTTDKPSSNLPRIKPESEPSTTTTTDNNEPNELVEPNLLEIDVLDSLTGLPLEQDELLFAIPVIAPYSALQNYKFRIKLIPGSTKRGKAAKYAMELFVRDKSARQHEKDLIKSVKDQDVARNFPGKVKLAGGAVDKKK